MARITAAHFAAAYDAGKDWVSGKITERQAVDLLVTQLGMSRGSASPYIRNLRQMLRGEEFQRTLNLRATEFYLLNIRADFGEAAYRNALASLEAHLDYYANLSTGHEQTSLRTLLAEHKARLTGPTLLDVEAALEADVQSALKRSPAERRRRLAAAPKMPAKTVGTVVIYKRNPDVIAEVLLRAHGRCERCGDEAPFKKKSDGSPYLEVHHKVRLADCGEDTLENAIAVCPNCHRQEHYG